MFFGERKPVVFLIALLVCISLFSGCGGSGDSGSSPANSENVFTAIRGQIAIPDAVATQIRHADATAYNQIEVWLEQLPEKRTFCDAQGKYLIDGLSADQSYNVVARLNGSTHTYIQRSQGLLVEYGKTTDAGETKLELAQNRLSIIVKDLFGNPIANARYSVWGLTGITDLQGLLISPAVPAAVSSINLIVEAAGFTAVKVELPVFSEDLGPLLTINLSKKEDNRRTPLILFKPVIGNVLPGSLNALSIFVIDPDKLLPQNYTIDWKTTDGELLPDGKSATWKAPDQNGLASVSVAISVDGFSSSASLGFAVGGSYKINTRVTAFSPVSAASGQTVSITGYGFGAFAESNRVLFGSAAGSISSWADTEIKVVMPVTAESGELLIEIGNKTINAGTFSVIDYATNLIPTFGPPETIVLITGYGFGDSQSDSVVTLGNKVIPVLKWTNTQIQAKINRSSHSGLLGVTIRGRLRPVADYTVSKIDSIDPNRTTRLTDGSLSVVAIKGVGFGDEQNESKVTFGADLLGQVVSWSDSEIDVEVPFAAVSGDLVIEINGAKMVSPRLDLVYSNNYSVELSFSGPRLESKPFLPGLAVNSSGDVLVSDYSNGWVWVFDENGEFVCRYGSPGSSDGQLNLPWGVAVDSEGNIFVADEPDQDTAAEGRIQKFSSEGNFLTSLNIGGSGPGQLDHPLGIAVDKDGNVYVADSDNHRIQKFSNELTFISEFGTLGQSDGQFNLPAAIAISADGKIYVADLGNNRIQEFSVNGSFLRWYGLDQLGESSWKAPGSGLSGRTGILPGQFKEPSGLFVALDGFLYVSDTDNGRLQKISLQDGTAVVIGEQGRGDGQFMEPVSMFVQDTAIYVADADNSRIQIVDSAGSYKKKIVPETDSLNTFFTRLAVNRAKELVYALDREDGSIAVFDLFGTFIGRIGARGSGHGQLLNPSGLFVDNNTNNILVADTGNARISVFSEDGDQQLAFGAYGTGPGQFRSPERVVVGLNGMILVSDYDNNRIVVFSASGDYSFSFGSPGNKNGQFAGPLGLAVSSDGSIYVADSGNARVQKFTSEGSFLGWFGEDETGNAGWHSSGSSNNGVKGTGQSSFKVPTDIAVDFEDCVYVLDGEAGQIQKFGPNQADVGYAHHIITLGSETGFVGLSCDQTGNLYTTEQDQVIRRFKPSLN